MSAPVSSLLLDSDYQWSWQDTCLQISLVLLIVFGLFENHFDKFKHNNGHKGALGVTSVTKMECYNKWSCQCTCLLKCVWLLMVTHGCSWLLMVTHGYS